MIAFTGVRVIMVNRFASVAGGAEKHAVGLARLLRSRGHEVAFLSTLSDDNRELDGAFVPLAGSDFWRGPPPVRERLEVAAGALWNRRAAGAAAGLLTRFEPDVVHLHDIYPQLSVAPVVVAAKRGVPVVQTLHNYELMSASPVDHRGSWRDRGDGPASVRWLRAALHAVRQSVHVPRVDRWVAVSDFVAKAYARHGIHAESLPNFIEAPRDAARGFDEREGVVFAGRLTPEKGVRDVIEMARSLPGVPVTVAGRGPLDEEVRVASRELSGLRHAGELDGPGVAAALAGARLAVVPSRWEEPAGLVALEAMAEGTPVVAYARGGLGEYVGRAGAGPVVPPAASAMIGAARKLLSDRDAWSRCSERGREAVATTHAPDRYAERIEDLYTRAAAG